MTPTIEMVQPKKGPTMETIGRYKMAWEQQRHKPNPNQSTNRRPTLQTLRLWKQQTGGQRSRESN